MERSDSPTAIEGTFFSLATSTSFLSLLPFYHISEDAKTKLPWLPDTYGQFASFNHDHILKHFGNAIIPYIVRSEIPTMTLEDLLVRNGITRIDVLHIDTEGADWMADWMILSQLDLSRYRPLVILIEFNHLKKEDKDSMLKYLSEFYNVKELEIDLFCTRK